MFSSKNFSFPLGEKTYIMGILNVTNDSFFDGGLYNTPAKALEHAKAMIMEGADIIDIGAQSTRPGCTKLSVDEELSIIKEYLPMLYNKTGAVISVDTFYPEVAEYALQNGASIINDVSGYVNEQMAKLVAEYSCGWVVMHTGGGNAQNVPKYERTVTEDVASFFNYVLKICEEHSIGKNQIMLDIGIGFGKTYEQNIELIKNLDKLKIKNVALLTALSSKRVIGTATETDGRDRLYGTLAANVLAVKGGTDFIRVHNVKENALAIKMADVIIRG